MREDPSKLLAEIKRLDAVHWSSPSDGLSLKIDRLEKDYEDLTGQRCPAWPRRIQ
ncbi:hypothetical protein [Paracoccus sp. TOH]|uniref:hypothetical protein n=1 Tax=Paracoccus sp. TOH TaxID=1263728 RepID=UPI0025B26BB8|nr:hypothetical protein [Paracoccus sp. TOH]WJS87289.1 hypothetical protein NBE95_20635 [Paracoccus sp. TOH]